MNRKTFASLSVGLGMTLLVMGSQPLAASDTPYAPLGFTETPVATANNNGFEEPMGVVQYMKQREAAGGKVDREHPFPKDVKGWPPGTRHPHGYGTLVWLFYSVFNYTGSLWALHLTQIFADAVACLFVFLFARNVFDTRIGVIAAWLYALCPPAVFLSIDLF